MITVQILKYKLTKNSFRPIKSSCCIWLCIFISVYLVINADQVIAQDIHGTVTGKGDNLTGAIIRNVRSQAITVSDINGRFLVRALYGDTLLTSFISYKTDTLIFKSQSNLNVILQVISNNLSEVTIFGTKLDPYQKYLKNRQDFKQIYRVGDKSHMFFASGGLGTAGIGLNIDALYSALSKEGRDARHLQNVLISDYHGDLVDSRFTPVLVARVTGYSGHQLEDFIINNKPTYEFIQKATDYDIIQYIQRRAGGITLQSDNPVMSKAEGHSPKIRFKFAKVPAEKRLTTAEFLPIRP
jgi:hypothetical protein